jgi:uncharacterized protein (UPF0548 family)
MIFVGDVFQVPPVLTIKDNDYIFQNYKSQYFFDAPCLNETKYQLNELTKIFRQDEDEEEFKNTLNRIRLNEITDKDLKLINSRYNQNYKNEDVIYLTTRREMANEINLEKLKNLSTPAIKYEGVFIDAFEKNEEKMQDEDRLPAPYNLTLKEGAQVVFVKNDKLKRWANGTIGKISKLSNNSIAVNIKDKIYNVNLETWEQVEYNYNKENNIIEKQIVGKYIQYPLRLAYAITIHKSQGMTFEKVFIDIGKGAFTHGQVYVALSRCRRLSGIHLTTTINETDIMVDPRVLYYYKTKTNPQFQLNSIERRIFELEKMFMVRLDEATDIMYEQYSYSAPVLKKMVSQLGVRNAVRKLVNSPKPNEGLLILKNKRALHLCMEALILENTWKDLFTENDRENAKKRLTQLGFDYRNNKYF